VTDSAPPLAGLYVVVVEDDTYVRDLVSIVLEHAGARVTACANGAQALDALQIAVPDVIVMDINLPGPSGLSVIGMIRHLGDPRARAAPAVALSGSIEPFEVEQILEAGFTECLGKPVSLELLVGTVGRLAGRVT
jgi:CheY-like chemotaxis protein